MVRQRHKPKPSKRSDPQLNQAMAAYRAGDAARAVSLFRSILRRRPRLAEAHYALALILPGRGAVSEALDHARMAAKLDPANALHHYALGALLRDTGDLDAALDAYTRAGWLNPSLADCHADAAALLEELGRLDEARSSIDRALKANPDHPRAGVLHVRIAMRTDAPDDDQLAQWVESLQPVAETADDSLARSLAWTTLADIHDTRADTQRAFEAFTRCNRIEREIQRTPSDAERDGYLRNITDLAASLTPEKSDRWRTQTPDDDLPSPALLVGFPRSGTTMTERAIDAHPRARSIEEQPTFEDTRAEMARLLGPAAQRRPMSEALDALTTDHLAHLRRFYWRRAAREIDADPADVLVLDKFPLRIAELPLVNRLFPDAKVLVALRDPRDVCLSCFRQRFTLNVPMSFFLDLHDTARLYAHVMQAWLDTRDAYTFPWLEIRYEQTVADFESRIRAILDFLDLEWDDAVLSFHQRTDRASRTPSYHAVREKVSTRAVGRWHRYRDQLAPILPTLHPLIEALGYDTQPGHP